MLSKKTLAIFINENDDEYINYVDTIYNFFQDQYEDFVIISDENDSIKSNYAVIPSIHLKFFQGTVVFLSVKTHLEKNDILADEIYVVTSVGDIIANHIPKNRLNNIKILSIQNNKIEVISYGKLQ